MPVYWLLWAALVGFWLSIAVAGCHLRIGASDSEEQGLVSSPRHLRCSRVTSNGDTHCFCFMDGYQGCGRMTWAPEGMCAK